MWTEHKKNNTTRPRTIMEARAKNKKELIELLNSVDGNFDISYNYYGALDFSVGSIDYSIDLGKE